MNRKTRVTVSNESLYGERKTLAGWREWLKQKFDEVPPEYRDAAILEINSEGGYEGEHHTEATLYFDRPETPEEVANRKAVALARAEEAERLSRRWKADAERLRKEAGESR